MARASKNAPKFEDQGRKLMKGEIIGLETVQLDTSKGQQTVANFYLVDENGEAVRLSDWNEDRHGSYSEGDSVTVMINKQKRLSDGRIYESVEKVLA